MVHHLFLGKTIPLFWTLRCGYADRQIGACQEIGPLPRHNINMMNMISFKGLFHNQRFFQ